MIVHPDFLDHWKTAAFVKLMGDPAAPLLILRLWGYCQMQKTSEFAEADLLPKMSRICRSEMPGDKIIEFLVESSFLRREGDKLIVHDWERSNRILRSAWENGKRSATGRSKIPPTPPVQNRKEKTGCLSAADRGAAGSQSVVKPDPDAAVSFGKALGDLTKHLRAGDGSGSENL